MDHCHHPHLALAINTVPPEPAPSRAALSSVARRADGGTDTEHHGHRRHRRRERPTPRLSPWSMLLRRPTQAGQRVASGQRSTGTMQFSGYAGSESGEEQNLRDTKAELESVPKTPKKPSSPRATTRTRRRETRRAALGAPCARRMHAAAPLVPGARPHLFAARPTWPFLRGHAALEEVRGPLWRSARTIDNDVCQCAARAARQSKLYGACNTVKVASEIDAKR